jgi:hypothetical protein
VAAHDAGDEAEVEPAAALDEGGWAAGAADPAAQAEQSYRREHTVDTTAGLGRVAPWPRIGDGVAPCDTEEDADNGANNDADNIVWYPAVERPRLVVNAASTTES